jgi:glutamate/aspartate transport system permease protein
MMGNLDLSFFSWNVLAPFVIKGFIFSIWLTIVATIGGIILGTILALMRLSARRRSTCRPPPTSTPCARFRW